MYICSADGGLAVSVCRDTTVRLHYSITVLTVAHNFTHCVNGDIAFLCEWSKFDPLTKYKPIHQLR